MFRIDQIGTWDGGMGARLVVLSKLIRRLQYSPSHIRHEAAHDAFGIVYGSRCSYRNDLEYGLSTVLVEE